MKYLFVFILMFGCQAFAEDYICYDISECYQDPNSCSIESLRQDEYSEKLTIDPGVSARISTRDMGLDKKVLKVSAEEPEGYYTDLSPKRSYTEYHAYLRVDRTLPAYHEFLKNIWAEDGRVFVNLLLKLEDPLDYVYLCERTDK